MPAGKHREAYRRPRTGEKRRTRQPTAIEKLPGELRDKVRAFVDDARNGRCRCQKQPQHRHSWEGMEEVANQEFGFQFGGEVYRRDHDIFVEQVRRENLERNQSFQTLVEAFAARGIEGLPAAAMNALTGESLAALNAKDPEVRQAAMLSFGVVLAKLLTAKAAQEKLSLEKEKLATRREAMQATSPREVYLAAVEELLKKLRTRKAVREVLDPIAKELIEELSKSAESFTKRIEAQQA